MHRFRRLTAAGSRLVLLILIHAHIVIVHAGIEQRTVDAYLETHRAAGSTPNRLIGQSSPYLLQHAYNPVQWYPWGEEAFEQARKQNKPIFLSIGYSTCYWCHVMAHESFENGKIAALLNAHFISIKLDREERPDIDNVYMAATELVNGYGGWPMTVFLNHDLEPFHAGVYYPPFTTDNSTGLHELLLKVSELWRGERARIDMVADQITAQIKAAGAGDPVTGVDIDTAVIERGIEQIADSFDEEHGGFGAAPKFPRPGIHALLLKAAAGSGDDAEQARSMLRDTLLAMARGGIHDQVGGGFHRYAVDERWQVPHFEKMLYTQALMALAYTRLYELEPDERYRDVATATLAFVLAEMRHPQGGFYSALDASSERVDRPGESAEGAYYLWRATELRSLLGRDEWALVERYFDIQQHGNIASDPRGEFKDLNILYVDEAFDPGKLTAKQRAMLASAGQKLYRARLDRPRPHLDDKIITAWNGLMIRALTDAARVFDDKSYLAAAVAAADYIYAHLVDARSGTMLRRIRNGSAGIDAGLIDYVWYVNGLLALYQLTDDQRWLDRALKLTSRQTQLFQDKAGGGFFESTAGKHLLFRSRTAYDGALPAPNAVAAENLYLLASLTGDCGWRRLADATVAAFAASINDDPAAAGWMLSISERTNN